MKSYGKYISKFLISFFIIILLLLCSNAMVFFWMFQNVVSTDYGDTSPHRILEKVSHASTPQGIPTDLEKELHQKQIWAIFLSPTGECLWQVDLPENVPTKYTIQDVAIFSKGYLKDYPVFVQADDAGLLVLGYPQNSYIKITGNYYSSDMLKIIPRFFTFIGIFDLTIIFLIYFLSKQQIIKNTEPIISSIETLSNGTPVTLSIKGELSSVADSVNRVSQILIRQNQARANWISGISHDIRTPLSMIMGYATHIAESKSTSDTIRSQAEIIRNQSIKIKELVRDLNLVSQLEYDMQPLYKKNIRISKLLRSYIADLLNTGISDIYNIEFKISPNAENAVLECDAQLILRAINNIVQNSIKHNPNGCDIYLTVKIKNKQLIIVIIDNGVGLSKQKLQDLEQKPHYMESTDDRLDLRHGLGLLIVKQIVLAHHGVFKIKNVSPHGCKSTLIFHHIEQVSPE